MAFTNPWELLDVVPDGVLLVREDGTIAFTNAQSCTLFGYTRDELADSRIERLLPRRLREQHAGHLARYFRNPATRPMETSHPLSAERKDGTEFSAEISLSPFESADGTLVAACIRDVSSRLRITKTLEACQSTADMLFQSVPVPCLMLDSQGRVCDSNLAAKKVLPGLDAVTGWGSYGAAIRCVHSIEHPEQCGGDVPCDDCCIRRIVVESLELGNTVHQREVALEIEEGEGKENRYLLVSTAVSKLPQGRRVLVCLEDITARKSAELELRAAVEEIGKLKDRLQQENLYLQEEIKRSLDFEQIVGNSEPLNRTLQKTEQAAAADITVLILGETGTGKELIARAIHEQGPRKDRPLITVNCAALPSSLIESELFGVVRGAFTGADFDKVGRFELADGGTLFLDEIGELDLGLQAKLLRVLQDGRYERLGSSVSQSVDVHVVAATNRDLKKAMNEGLFRPDLYYRLAVFPIEVPALRDRRADIPLLAWHFVRKKQARLGKLIKCIPETTMQALMQYDWPGNVRELENVVERAVILSPGSSLLLDEVFAGSSKRDAPAFGDQNFEEYERNLFLQVLEDCRWRIQGDGNAASRLGLKPSTLRSRLKKLGIQRP